MAINLYTGNKLEALARRLADVVRRPLGTPFLKERIVVQSKGMERWLSLELSGILGVWANCEFPFPNTMLEELFSAVLPDSPEDTMFRKEMTSWRVMGLLPGLLPDARFAQLRNYLGAQPRQLKLWQLSERVADAFDQYLVYRPAMLQAWEHGDDDLWQAELWRSLVRGTGGGHRAALLKKFTDRLDGFPQGNPVPRLPERISVFGISLLPEFHLAALAALSRHTEVNIFFLNPCREYWGDIRTARERSRIEKRAKPGDDLHIEKGNSLLSSMGKCGRDFLWLLLESDPELEYDDEFEPGGRGLLATVQGDILDMRDRGAGDTLFDLPRITMSRDASRADGSIRISSCHSPMREMEALHDYLLDAFNGDPGLEPRHVLVMTPDIETYAPLMQAVFGSPESESMKIPFSIADRSVLSESGPVKAFFDVLEIAGSRFGAASVMGILQCEDVRRRFDIGMDDLDLIAGWVRGTGIRWGLDARHRAGMGLPAAGEHTWRAGLDRLLLGYAMERNGLEVCGDILPFDVEGTNTGALGNFLEYFGALSEFSKSLAVSGGADEWRDTLLSLLDRLFLPGEDSRGDLQSLRDALYRFAELAGSAGFSGTLDREVVASILKKEMERPAGGAHFITGQVTLCAMLPMRSIPFRVICLLGLNDGVFPRNPYTAGFDLIAANPQRGDRSVRDEDRYLFLETIISARERLYLSYVGQSIKDNTAIPPSPLVSELLDYLDRAVEAPGGIRDAIVMKHRLQAFSTRYFDGTQGLYSYSGRNLNAAQELVKSRTDKKPFFTGPLPAQEQAAVPVRSLVSYYANPAREILAGRLDLRIIEKEALLEEREPFGIDALDAYDIGNEVLHGMLRGAGTGTLREGLRAAGSLPQGIAGDVELDKIFRTAGTMSRRIKQETEGGALPPVDADVMLEGCRLSGRLDSLYSGGQLFFDYGNATVKRRIKAWIMHLIMLGVGDIPCPPRTVLVCRDQVWRMGGVPDARAVLSGLASVYRQGMQRFQKYYPQTSFAYAEMIFKGKNTGDAVAVAKKMWEDPYKPMSGEGSDRYMQVCTGGEILLDGEFRDLAVEIFRPMLEHQTGEKR